MLSAWFVVLLGRSKPCVTEVAEEVIAAIATTNVKKDVTNG
ncbi:MAG: hypothetical protein V7K69_23875 [Nostoc sp.]